MSARPQKPLFLRLSLSFVAAAAIAAAVPAQPAHASPAGDYAGTARVVTSAPVRSDAIADPASSVVQMGLPFSKWDLYSQHQNRASADRNAARVSGFVAAMGWHLLKIEIRNIGGWFEVWYEYMN